MSRVLGVVAAVTMAACSNTPNGSGVPEDSGEASESPSVSDSGSEGDGPQDSGSRPSDARRPDSGHDSGVEEPPCVPDGGFYTCSGGSWPACPPAVYAVADPYAGCDFSLTSCMRCDGVVGGMNIPPMIGTGATCLCRDAGYPIPDGSTGYWDCVGTGSSCQ